MFTPIFYTFTYVLHVFTHVFTCLHLHVFFFTYLSWNNAFHHTLCTTTLPLNNFLVEREKERDPTQSYDENPYTNRKLNNQLTTQRRHQNFDHTTIVDRLRTVSWNNNSHE